MATTYTATIEVKCWKEHTCQGCGGQFSYLLVRKVKGTAASQDKAAGAARAAAVTAIQRDVDMRPCPKCGLFQPDMIGARRARQHWIWLWVGLAALVALLILYLTDLVPMNVLAWCAAGGFGLLTLFQALVVLSNPNRNLEANRQQAQQSGDSGAVQQGGPPGPEPEPTEIQAPSRPAGLWMLILFPMVIAILAALPELMRTGSGWPLNPGWYPPVAGPGDSTYLYLPHRISSIRGYWNGTATVVAEEVGQVAGRDKINIPAETNQSSWGQSISAKSSEKSSNSTLWARLKVPAAPDLAGKHLKCAIALAVSYPMAKGNQFDNVNQPFNHVQDLNLATSGAGRVYKGAWWGGFLIAGGLFVVLSAVLIGMASALKKRALPTNVYPYQGAGG
jgi:hypothetical protein